MNSKTIRRITICILAVVIAASAAIFAVGVFTSLIYKPSSVAQASLESTSEIGVYYKDNYLVFTPMDGSDTALVFYPADFIAPESYAPLMQELASRGVTGIIVKPFLSLSSVSANSAAGVRENFPGIERWYIGGHSTGGTSAATYLAKHPGDFDGLILFASSSSKDLTGSGLRCLSIYGSVDSVMNRKQYARRYSLLPEQTEEFIIEGGNFSYFGSYGGQIGDTRGLITSEKQVEITADKVASFTRSGAAAKP